MAISTKKRLAISMAALCLCACSQESAHALVATSALTTTGIAELVAPNVLSLTHRDRLLDGELYASSTRLDWRTLLKRTFDIDLRVCVGCGGRLTVRAVVTAPAAIAKMLAALRRPRAPPAVA